MEYFFKMQTDQKQVFIEWLESKGLKPKTIKEYGQYYNKIRLFKTINQETIREFLSLNNNVVARAFLKNIISFYKANKDLLGDQKLEDILDIELPKITGRKKKDIPDVLTKRDIARIKEFMPTEKTRLMLLISYFGALRVGELFSISYNSIKIQDFLDNPNKSGEIIVRGKGDQAGICIIPPKLMRKLLEWINTLPLTNELVEKSIWKIDRSISPRRWADILDDVSQKAIGRRVNPHLLRHSMATNLMRKGLDIRYLQEFMRHRNITSTQVYTHVVKEDLKDKLSGILGN